MKYNGVIISGTNGSGKNTVVTLLASDREFRKIDMRSTDSIKSVERKMKTACSKGKIPIVVLPIKTAISLTSLDPLSSSPPKYLSFFMDLDDNLLNESLKNEGISKEALDAEVSQRISDRTHQDLFMYYLCCSSSQKCASLIKTLCKTSDAYGVAPARIIKSLMECGSLLTNGSLDNIEGASYDLSLGDEYYYKGRIHTLTKKQPLLLIEPYDYAIVTSRENANMPKDFCGRFDLSVSLFCQGVILSNGPQIDPGFRGILFCLLLNSSSSPVLLKRGQHYATIEFIKLIEPTHCYKGHNQDKSLLHYLPITAAQGAINELKKQIEDVSKHGKSLQSMTWSILSLILALIAIWVSFK
jgi:deoxycytidine triphosphate deaminase